jgi:hypothetical protein
MEIGVMTVALASPFIEAAWLLAENRALTPSADAQARRMTRWLKLTFDFMVLAPDEKV